MAKALALAIALGDPQYGCTPKVPASLVAELARAHAGMHMVTLHDLSAEDQGFFAREHSGNCPGVIHVDFFGDGQDAYAILLSGGRGKSQKTELIVATSQGGGKWRLRTLEKLSGGGGSTPVVVWMPPDTYSGVYGDTQLVARYPAIGFQRFEAVFIVYAWNGKSVEKVWLQD